MVELLDELKAFYGKTRLFGRITTAAGNTSLAAMSKAIEHGWHYFAQIKSELQTSDRLSGNGSKQGLAQNLLQIESWGEIGQRKRQRPQ